MGNSRESYHRVKVLKLIWSIPHYRVPIFRRLSQHPYLDFTVCAGDSSKVFDGAQLATAREVGDMSGVNWRLVKSSRIRFPLFNNYEWQGETIKIVWKENPDVVICFGIKSLSNWLVRVICRLRGIPVIEWGHGIRTAERGLKWAVRKFYHKWAKAHLLYAKFARDFYVTHGFGEDEVFVVNNSLDHERQLAIREKLTEDDLKKTRIELGAGGSEDRLIFYSGRLEKRKNLPILIDALKVWKERGRKIVLLLIGQGQEEPMLQDYVQSKGLSDQVVFYGSCYDEVTVGRIISSSDLCVVPGTVGLIAMHSLVYGTPLLTCMNTKGLHSPEVETIIEGKTGAYFREGDLDDLVRKMDMMLYPVPCRQRMSQACKQIIDTYYTPSYQERVIIKAINYVLPQSKRIPLPVE